MEFRKFHKGLEKESAAVMLTWLFGVGKGSGAAMLFCVIGIVGVAICLGFSLILQKYKWSESE